MVIAERHTSVESKPKPKLPNTGIVFERPKQYSRVAVAENILASIYKNTLRLNNGETLSIEQIQKIVDLKATVQLLTRRVAAKDIPKYKRKAKIKLLKKEFRKHPRDRQIRNRLYEARRT